MISSTSDRNCRIFRLSSRKELATSCRASLETHLNPVACASTAVARVQSVCRNAPTIPVCSAGVLCTTSSIRAASVATSAASPTTSRRASSRSSGKSCHQEAWVFIWTSLRFVSQTRQVTHQPLGGQSERDAPFGSSWATARLVVRRTTWKRTGLATRIGRMSVRIPRSNSVDSAGALMPPFQANWISDDSAGSALHQVRSLTLFSRGFREFSGGAVWRLAQRPAAALTSIFRRPAGAAMYCRNPVLSAALAHCGAARLRRTI